MYLSAIGATPGTIGPVAVGCCAIGGAGGGGGGGGFGLNRNRFRSGPTGFGRSASSSCKCTSGASGLAWLPAARPVRGSPAPLPLDVGVPTADGRDHNW